MGKSISQIIQKLLREILAKRNKENSKYEVGDRVKFTSDQPSVYLSRYADGDSKIEEEEHIGIIKNIHTIKKGWYSYAIETFPIQWLCFVSEKEIICKLANEFKMKNLDELYGYMWLKPDVTNINADIFVDDGKAYLRDNHVPLLYVRNGIGREITEFIPISISETPAILDESIAICVDTTIIKQIMDFIKDNIYTLMAFANGIVSAENVVLSLRLRDVGGVHGANNIY